MCVFRADVPLPTDSAALREREWLVTNGLGGYASGTLAGVPTRRYHGLLMANLAAPRGRHLLVSRLDEELHCDGRTLLIGGADFARAPAEHSMRPVLRSFELEGNCARWLFESDGMLLERSLLMPRFRNTVCVRYRLLRGTRAKLILRPFLPMRRQDAPLRQSAIAGLKLQSGTEPDVEIVEHELGLQLRLCTDPPQPFVVGLHEAPPQLLRREQARGYEAIEVLTSPGYFRCELSPDSPLTLFASAESWDRLDRDGEQQFAAERRRVTAMLEVAALPADPLATRLVQAADQFLILPENRAEERVEAAAEGHPLRTVIAGYHWFGDWGRDTMISLEGLMLATRRFREARATLLTFAHYLRDGLLPNLFPEGASDGMYHTIDATLWYFHAIHRYVAITGDAALVDELLPQLRQVIEHHLRGTRFGIRVDSDGLLDGGTADHALTWMDAHYRDWIVTPRRGKPVEIQALWYNALRLMQGWESDDILRQQYADCAARAYESFNRRFWNGRRRCLFDVVDGETGNDARLRPNQLFAISLEHPVLERGRWAPVLQRVQSQLLTPVGLRTLEQRDPDYRHYYQGHLRARDSAYHQGTVWPWLLGPFIESWLKVHADKPRARRFLAAFEEHLHRAGVGSISEVFDGEPPHGPHGCIAQAWSVAEILRAWRMTATDP